MSEKIKSEILDAIRDLDIAFYKEKGGPSKYIHLTANIQKKIESLTVSDIGDIATDIFMHGVSEALPTILGLEILSWDSKSMKIG